MDDVAVTGFVDLHRLGVAIAPVNDDVVAVVGSDWDGAKYERALELFDVHDPYAPRLLGSDYAPGQASAVAIGDGHAYLADPEFGLVVFDIRDPASPVNVGHYEQADVYDVKIDGTYAYLSFTAAFEESDPSGFLVLDIRHHGAPELAGSFQTTGSAYGLAVHGGHVFATNENLIRIVDVGDPTHPTEVATYETADATFNLEIVDEHAYVANFASGIQVIDVSDILNPRFMASVATDIVNYDVTVAGTHAYVPDDQMGLKLLNLEDPASPFVVDTYRPPYWARDVAVIANHAFVAEFLYGAGGRLYCLKMCSR